MANSGTVQNMDHSDGADIAGRTFTADFQSAAYQLSGFDWFGAVVELGTVSGTSQTLDVEVQLSLDSGSTFLVTYGGDFNVGGQAQLTQMTASNQDQMEVWQNFLPLSGLAQVRFNFNLGGTSPSFAITNAYFIGGARRSWRP